MVAQTMDAIQALTPEEMQTPLATPTALVATVFSLPPTATPNTGEVSGEVCYRNGSMSQLTLYFENTGTNVVMDIPVSRPQTTYSIQLEPGTYNVYGWPPDYSIGVLHEGGVFQVTAGQETTGIDICDWSHGPFDVPYPPGYSPLTGSGSISGGIYGYPYGGLPQMFGSRELTKDDLAAIRRMSALNRRLALLEMTNHEFLDNNYRKERATFADGTTVTVDWDAKTAEIRPEVKP